MVNVTFSGVVNALSVSRGRYFVEVSVSYGLIYDRNRMFRLSVPILRNDYDQYAAWLESDERRIISVSGALELKM